MLISADPDVTSNLLPCRGFSYYVSSSGVRRRDSNYRICGCISPLSCGANFACLTDVSSVRVESTDMITTLCVTGDGIGGSGVEFTGKYI